jgi:hypothetical protein
VIITSIQQFWNEQLQLPLLARLGPSPEEIVQYVTLVNQAMNNPGLPTIADASDQLIADVQDAMREMPAVVQHLLEDSPLLGVYFASGLGSSAVTDAVVSPEGAIMGFVTVLDIDACMNRSANEWATWKENTPFADPGDYALELEIQDSAGDNRKNAIQFLLLHEFGHVITGCRGFLPDWWIDPQTLRSGDDYPFLRLSWQINEEKKIVPRAAEDFSLRSQLGFYEDRDMSREAMLEVYKALRATSFATAYAVTNAYEDFAESFATYVHTVLMGKRYVVCISHQGEEVLRHEHYWDAPRAAAKRHFMERLLAEG